MKSIVFRSGVLFHCRVGLPILLRISRTPSVSATRIFHGRTPEISRTFFQCAFHRRSIVSRDGGGRAVLSRYRGGRVTNASKGLDYPSCSAIYLIAIVFYAPEGYFCSIFRLSYVREGCYQVENLLSVGLKCQIGKTINRRGITLPDNQPITESASFVILLGVAFRERAKLVIAS